MPAWVVYRMHHSQFEKILYAKIYLKRLGNDIPKDPSTEYGWGSSKSLPAAATSPNIIVEMLAKPANRKAGHPPALQDS